MRRRDAFVVTTYMGCLVTAARVRPVSSSYYSSSFTTATINSLPRPHQRPICRHPPLPPSAQTHHSCYPTILPSTPSPRLRARALATHRSFSLLHRSSPHIPSYSAINPITRTRTLATMAEPVSHSRPAGVERLADRLHKPLLDDRSYRVVKLPNQLEALLIHDADTDKASAAMDVNVGSFSDLKDLPGIAHAVEHLLFMGTEKVRNYPTSARLFASAQKTNHMILLVPRRERIQLLPYQIRRQLQCLHRAHLYQLLLRTLRLLHSKEPFKLRQQQQNEPASPQSERTLVRRPRPFRPILHPSAFPRRYTRSRAARRRLGEQEELAERPMAHVSVEQGTFEREPPIPQFCDWQLSHAA